MLGFLEAFCKPNFEREIGHVTYCQTHQRADASALNACYAAGWQVKKTLFMKVQVNHAQSIKKHVKKAGAGGNKLH